MIAGKTAVVTLAFLGIVAQNVAAAENSAAPAETQPPPATNAVSIDAASTEDQAIAELREAIRLAPGYADAHLALGVALYTLGDLPAGIAELREAIRLKPDHINARYHLALALLKQRDRLDLPEKNRTATSTEPILAEAYLELGKTLAATGDMAGAVTELREALVLQPNFVQARLALAFALYNAGELEAAIEEYRSVLRLQPDLAVAHLQLATALMAKHDWSAANTELKEALRLQSDLVQAHYTLGSLRYTMGDVTGALESYRQAVRLKPGYADAHHNLGVLLKLTGKDEEAVQEFLAAAGAGVPQAQYFLGTAYAGGLGVKRNLALAVKWWSQAADQGSDQARDALAHQRQVAIKGKSVDEVRAIQQAFKEYRKELWQEFPDLAGDGEDSLGMRLLRLGRLHEGVVILLREAYALSEPAHVQLETLYEHGAEGFPKYDQRILSYFKRTATDGHPGSRLMLARIYARGLGVAPELAKASALLNGDSQEDAQRLLQEIVALQRNSKQATRPSSPVPGSP